MKGVLEKIKEKFTKYSEWWINYLMKSSNDFGIIMNKTVKELTGATMR